MLDAGVVDAVDITTEVGIHHPQTLACLEAGVHALVEKPLAITMRAARLMVDAAHRRGLQLAVCEHARYLRMARLGGWLVARGDLGTPQMASWPSIGTALWSPDNWVGNSNWRHRKVIGAGGCSLDIGPHVFHRLRVLCGEVESVSALARVVEPTRYLRDADGEILDTVECDADDVFMALATFATGAIGQFSFAFAGHGAPSIPAGPIVYGSKGLAARRAAFPRRPGADDPGRPFRATRGGRRRAAVPARTLRPVRPADRGLAGGDSGGPAGRDERR